MTTTPEVHPPDRFANAHDTRLWVERLSSRRWTGHNSRGARVEIGSTDVEGVFSPGELLKVALAGCAGLTADAPLERRFGADFPATIKVGGLADADDDRYPALADELVVDMSGLDDAARHRLLVSLRRAVDAHCTVARTLRAGARTTFTVAGEDPPEVL